LSKLLRFREYTPQWEQDFIQIQDYLDRFLGNLVIGIHHVGSTSVKGLGAKPIIDVDIEYEHYFNEIKRLLVQNKYEFEGEKGIKGRYSFRFQGANLPEHHLYVIHSDEVELQKHITFRDALRRFPIYREMYHQVKQKLIEANNKNRLLYTENKTEIINLIMKESEKMKTIVFAGGCFWGVEAYFKLIEGVIDTEVGYIAGNGETSYQEVCAGSGHAEAVLIQYDGTKVSLKTLLDHLFNIIDPTSINKQGNDIGVQYRTGIYNYTDQELLEIKAYIQNKQPLYKKPIAIELKTNLDFYGAEAYHQDYLEKNKNGYCHVNLSSHKNVK
jgi:methionine-S-sulfoxide reductase